MDLFLLCKLPNEFKLQRSDGEEGKTESLLKYITTVLVQSHVLLLSSGGKLQQYELKNFQFCTAHHAEFSGL